MAEKRFSISKRTGRTRKRAREAAGVEALEGEAAQEGPVGEEVPPSPDAAGPVVSPWRALGPVGRFGAIVLLAAVLGLVLNFTLPWALTQVEGGADSEPEVHDRSDLRGGTGYTSRLLDWPLAAFIIAIATSVLLLGSQSVQGVPERSLHVAEAFLLGVLAFFSFLLALSGTRFLGLQLVNLMSQDMTIRVTLHVVPYLNMILGIAGLVFAARLAREPLRGLVGDLREAARGGPGMAALMVGVCAVGLLLMPLLPYASSETASFYLGEGDLADRADTGSPLGDAAQALSWVHTTVWLVLFVSLAGLVAAIVDRARTGDEARAFVHVQALNAVPLVVMLVFAVLFYVRLSDVVGLDLFVNPFVPLTIVALLAGHVWYLVRDFVPFVRSLPSARSAAPDS